MAKKKKGEGGRREEFKERFRVEGRLRTSK